MTATFLLASALMSQAAALPTAAPLETAGDGQTITASARVQRSGWLTIASSGEEYRAWVSIADLDLTAEAGLARMDSRVRRAAAALCDASAEQPQVPGFYNPGARACWRKAQDQASAQMASAREAAQQGRAVATLGLVSSQ
jgi:UrcA family protein